MRILIIEDDIDLREFLKRNLASQSYAVDATSDGERGLFLAKTNDYDIVILDINLPRRSGTDICMSIREAGKNCYIVIVSVNHDTGHKINLLEIGADDYMTKPFSFNELLARIKSIARRPSDLVPNSISIDNLSLDCNKQKIMRGKKKIYLTRKEYALFEYLMRSKGKVLSRGMIMEHVWNNDNDPFSNTIEAHILNLRKKIDTGRNKKLIHNVPGRGYKIDTEL